ncbi:MAG: DNA-binding protein [bacterium]
MWAKVNEMRPRVLGALLDVVSLAMRELPRVRQTQRKLPRMADFADWIAAAAPALGLTSEAILRIYDENRADVVTHSLEGDVVAAAVLDLLAVEPRWSGTATECLNLLGRHVPEPVLYSSSWPRTPGVLSGRLRRAAPFFRRAGILLEFTRRGRAGERWITLSRVSGWSG